MSAQRKPEYESNWGLTRVEYQFLDRQQRRWLARQRRAVYLQYSVPVQLKRADEPPRYSAPWLTRSGMVAMTEVKPRACTYRMGGAQQTVVSLPYVSIQHGREG